MALNLWVTPGGGGGLGHGLGTGCTAEGSHTYCGQNMALAVVGIAISVQTSWMIVTRMFVSQVPIGKARYAFRAMFAARGGSRLLTNSLALSSPCHW